MLSEAMTPGLISLLVSSIDECHVNSSHFPSRNYYHPACLGGFLPTFSISFCDQSGTVKDFSGTVQFTIESDDFAIVYSYEGSGVMSSPKFPVIMKVMIKESAERTMTSVPITLQT